MRFGKILPRTYTEGAVLFLTSFCNLSRGERQGALDLLLGAIGGGIERGSPFLLSKRSVKCASNHFRQVSEKVNFFLDPFILSMMVNVWTVSKQRSVKLTDFPWFCLRIDMLVWGRFGTLFFSFFHLRGYVGHISRFEM